MQKKGCRHVKNSLPSLSPPVSRPSAAMVRNLLEVPHDDSKANPSTYNCDTTVSKTLLGGLHAESSTHGLGDASCAYSRRSDGECPGAACPFGRSLPR